MVPISPWDHARGFGRPVEPEVCSRQNGSFIASSQDFV